MQRYVLNRPIPRRVLEDFLYNHFAPEVHVRACSVKHLVVAQALYQREDRRRIKHYLEDFIPQALTRGIVVKIEIPDPPIYVSYDRDRIRQVLGNLLGNALKFAPANSQITVRLWRDAEAKVVFNVESRGPVISAEDRERVFERGMKVYSRGPGLGLGLWISRWIVQAHHGKIWCEAIDDGNKFVFELPETPPRSSPKLERDRT